MIKAAILCFGAALAFAGAANASVVVSSAATKHMNCSAGVCTPTAQNAVLNADELATMLGTSDVEVTTGSNAISIAVTAPVSWGSSSRLTLDAQHSVSIRSTMIVEGTGALTVTLDEGASGTLNFYPGGSVTFWDLSSSLIINGNPYTLVSEIATLAADITANRIGSYALAKDYDASVDGTYAAPPVQTIFSGTLEGLGHAIQNLSIDATHASSKLRDFAFIRITTSKAMIRDIGMANVSLTGKPQGGQNLAALVTENGGAIRNVYATGSISGIRVAGYIGGLVALASESSSIAASHSSCSLTITPQEGVDIEIGGLVAQNLGAISNSYVDGTLTGASLGGLVYDNGGSITGSYSTASIVIGPAVNGAAAGLAYTNEGTITTSHASATFTPGVYGNFFAGLVGGNTSTATISGSWSDSSITVPNGGSEAGLVGGNDGMIVNSYATGNVRAGNDDATGEAGGLVLLNGGTIEQSFSTGSVTDGGSQGSAGGFAEYNEGTILNSFATGAASGGRKATVGGFLASMNDGAITASYSTGAVQGEHHPAVGGFVGTVVSGQFSDSYWDLETSGEHRSPGGQPIHDAELKANLPPGFDPQVWGQSASINNGYPYLLSNPPSH